MELLKQNIHMERISKEETTQITLEDDVNLPEMKPDISSLCMEKGTLVIEEIKPGADAVQLRGKLVFSVLYHTMEQGSRLVCMEGKILFDERIRIAGLLPTDHVTISSEVEDLTVGIINSRKLSVQSLICLSARVEEIYDEVIPTGVSELGENRELVQYRQIPTQISQVALSRKDVLRVKEEMAISNGSPNIGQILWKCVEPGEMEFRLGDEKLYVRGEVKVFVLYEGEGEGIPRIFENTLPVSAELACSGCSENMIPDIRYRLGTWELSEKADADGEQRVFALELTIDLKINVYEEKKIDLITDIYGIHQEISGKDKTAELNQLLRCITGRCRIADHVKVQDGTKIMQLFHSEGSAGTPTAQTVKDGLLLRGSIRVNILYITGEDERPYGCIVTQLPYEYLLEIPGMTDKEVPGRIQTNLEQLSVTMADSEELEVKAVVSFKTTAMCRITVEMIGEVSQAPLDRERLAALPSIVIYVVKPGDNLWNIGKKYYVPVDGLMEMNNLGTQEVVPGQKLLIVKGN